MNPNLFPFEYLSLTQLGKVFDTDAYSIGRRLTVLGLRVAGGQPHPKAIEAGLVKRVTEHGGDPFWAWNRTKVVPLLEEAFKSKPTGQTLTLNGPFTSRPASVEGGDGWVVASADGTVAIWVRGQKNAEFVLALLNLAHKHNMVPGGQP